MKQMLPMSAAAEETVYRGRELVKNILDRKDPRIFMVVGPCSIHDSRAALEYAERLRKLAEEIKDTIFIIMRVYFEKPRTTIGWKGFINDPFMDDSFKIQDGLVAARKLLLHFAEMGLPAATEALDPITPQYMSDLWTWAAIGARTTESQTHRELASGLSMPVGFKNGTDGSIQVAIDALHSALRPHSFLGVEQNGRTAIFRTRGNRYGHLVLRGGGERPNYDSVSIWMCERSLEKARLPVNIVVDCSHANSFKDHTLQPLVLKNCINQIREGNRSIVGMMMESNLFEGNQPIPKDLSQLKYGVSVTDKCLDWQTTEENILWAYGQLKDIMPGRCG
jgi:3-deoxy-7-phosphoheptulonate synthase